MKKALVVLFCLLLSASVQAQLIRSYGIKLGGTASYQKWEYSPSSPVNLSDPGTKNGLNIGGFVEFLQIPVFSVVAEVNYIERGMQRDVAGTSITSPDGTGGTGGTKTWTLGLNYLNISLLGKARMDGIICTPYLIAGPKVDLEISKSDDLNTTFSNDFSKTRFGFKAGVGTEIKLFGINFLAEVLWNADLGNLYEGGMLKITTSAVDFRGGFSINM